MPKKYLGLDVNGWRKKGGEAYLNGKYNEAADAYITAFTRVNPGISTETLFGYGKALLMARQEKSARCCFNVLFAHFLKEAVLDPIEINTLYLLGVLFHEKFRLFSKALKCFEYVNELDPRNGLAWYNRAFISHHYYDNNKYALSCIDNTLCIEGQVDYRAIQNLKAHIYYAQAKTAYQQEKYDQALVLLDQIPIVGAYQEVQNFKIKILYKLAQLSYESEQYVAALRYAKQVLVIEENTPQAIELAADAVVALIRLYEGEQAISVLENFSCESRICIRANEKLSEDEDLSADEESASSLTSSPETVPMQYGSPASPMFFSPIKTDQENEEKMRCQWRSRPAWVS